MLTYEGTTPIRTPAGDTTQTNKLAFIWIGDLQYELIQPISGSVDIYRDALPAGDGRVLTAAARPRAGTGRPDRDL